MGEWRYRSTHILNLSIRWRCQFHALATLPSEGTSGIHWTGGWVSRIIFTNISEEPTVPLLALKCTPTLKKKAACSPEMSEMLSFQYNAIQHHSMACLQVVDGGDGFQIWRAAANILNKQSQTDDKG